MEGEEVQGPDQARHPRTPAPPIPMNENLRRLIKYPRKDLQDRLLMGHMLEPLIGTR